MNPPMVGVIGGSGLYQIEGLKGVRQVAVSTPFGKPSDKLVRGKLGNIDIVFLPRSRNARHSSRVRSRTSQRDDSRSKKSLPE